MWDEIFFAAEIDTHIALIDLHEFTTLPEALEQLEQKLFLFCKSEKKYVRVIYGIGSGRLKNAVLEALNKNPIVKIWRESEQGGSCIIIF